MELFVNNLTVIDFSFLDIQRGLVGESLIVDINIKGELDHQSMVMDFSKLKKEIKKYIDETIDHALVIPWNSPQVSFVSKALTAEVTLRTDEGEVDCYVSGPVKAFCPIQSGKINRDVIERWLTTRINAIMPANIESVSVSLREEHIGGHYYHYAHGLKKHEGNCQRIAHGHRSAIRIYINGERHPSWEMFWAKRWRDCYLMSEEDVVADFSKLSVGAQQIANENLIASAYTSTQGRFELLIRHGRVEILPYDTTVERIACYIKQDMVYSQPDLGNLVVHAYEGIEKGAIV
ncbi:6-carboxytetrahydropterin synthase [Erwinia sp. S63]|mgnify:CR=1 FL=1|uniref:6-carboxytetrahydropterin synthase n=1 Tax=Erwiniaceae TaxID=1903409 RepID=UPI00190DBB2B|nr:MULTISPECIES: 6-carboxytetrahydropterin synthase [Erwiniaceae]MBK0093596.1 6-carboxytetrahydropterin synthase [Erwinia sp. S59]MBK0099346.1 6-carboxytetrahydropterin synthase [Erwinia sp. S63]MBK0127336.1 6-carboxytetrahydropterin synthase [Pantoea sp. S61]